MADNETPVSKTGWQKFWTELLPLDVQIILAIGTTLAIILILAWIGINESARMEEFTHNYQARSIENGAVIFDSSCRGCHGPQGQGIEGIGPALNTPELFDGHRLEEVGWSGTLEDFVKLTVAAGRPSSPDYPNPMPTWGQEFGGPLRPDQVQDVTNFVLNWEETALAGELPGEAEEPSEDGPAEAYVGTDLEVELPEGDPESGQALFEGNLGCAGCHVAGAPSAAPAIDGIATRGGEITDLSAEAYIRESIQKPEAYVVEGYQSVMSSLQMGDKLTPQQLADLIAYLMTLE
jgi:mono/diheme cytochrome c family protein